jgi:AraC-like DNA-binding protein
MYEVVNALQRRIGPIALSDIPVPIEIRAYLCDSIPPPGSEIEHYVLEGLITLMRRNIEARAVRSVLAPGKTIAERGAVMLRDRFAEKWTIRRLAQELATNRFKLTTDFHAAHGIGVHAYLVQIRVAAAQERLAAGEKTDAVARDVGFRSNKTLYNAYRRVTGRSLRRTVGAS